MDVKITKDCYVPKEKVKFYCSYDSGYAKRLVRDAKISGGRVVDLTGGKKTLSIIVLDDWTFIRASTGLPTLNERMDRPSYNGNTD